MEKIMTFADREAFRDWHGKYGGESEGIWLLLSKTKGIVTLTANEALEEALCHGWIDGKIKAIYENTYKKYFARRLSNSRWSAKNKELAQSLIKKGLMARQGLEAIERAKKNGNWENAKRILPDGKQIENFRKIIKPFEPAYTNLKNMSIPVQFTYTRFYFAAKTENTRQARLEKIVGRLNKNLKPM